MARRRYKRRSYRRRRSYKRKGWAYPRSKKFRRAVQRIVRRNVETKKNQHTSGSIATYTSITDLEVFNLYPDIAQGVGQSNRVGNRINPVRFTLKLNITCANLNPVIGANVSPTYFDIYIFKFKGANQEGGFPTSADMTLFLQNDNSAQPYNGGTLAGLRPVNQDMFTLIKKKRVTLSNLPNGATTLGMQAAINPNRTVYFNLTKACKKRWIYDDNSTLLTNDNMYLAIGTSQTDGTLLTYPTQTGTYSFITALSYKDA